MSGPSQPKVEGEQWSDERIQAFLDLSPVDTAINPDYHVLLQAYQYMIPEFFARFIEFFVAANRDLTALSPDGETIFQRLSQHGRSEPYLTILSNHGAG